MSDRKIDCFGVVGYEKPSGVKLDEQFLDQFDIELDKSTGNTKVVKVGKINIVEQIQTYRDDCGMELMKKMIAQGADPKVFADDGLHGADCTLPTDLNEALAAAQAATAKANAAADKLGIQDYAKSSDIEKLVLDALNKIQEQKVTKVFVEGENK